MKPKLCLFIPLFALFLHACGQTQVTTIPASDTSAAADTLLPAATLTQPAPSETPIPETPICTPLADHELSSLTNYLSQPFIPALGENKELGHHGVDFAYYRRDGTGRHIIGTPIQSALNGYVAGFGFNPVYGNYLIVETAATWLPDDLAGLYPLENGDSLYLLYAHMQDFAPFVIDEPLDCGQVIGFVGGTGDAYFVSDPHLHFETRAAHAAIRLNPMSFYETRATDEEKAEYIFWRASETFSLFDPMILLNYGAEHNDG